MGIKFLAVTHAGCWGSHGREASDLQKKASQRRSSSVLGLPPRWKMAMLYDIGDLDVGCWSKFDTHQTSSTSSHIHFVLSDRYEWQCWMSLATVFNIFQRAHPTKNYYQQYLWWCTAEKCERAKFLIIHFFSNEHFGDSSSKRKSKGKETVKLEEEGRKYRTEKGFSRDRNSNWKELTRRRVFSWKEQLKHKLETYIAAVDLS